MFAIAGILFGTAMAVSPPTVFIIGNGAAAIGAMETLHKKGNDHFKVFEASAVPGVGGRVRKHSPIDPTVGNQYPDLEGLFYEEGAAWVKGTIDSSNHPLKDLVVTAQLETKVIDWENYSVLDESGNDITADFKVKHQKLSDAYRLAIADCDKLATSKNGVMDISLAAMLRRHGWNPTTPLENMVEWRSLDFEYAAQTKHVSCTHHSRFGYLHFGNKDQAVTDPRGFSHIFEKKLEEISPSGYKNDVRFQFGKAVRKIDSTGSRVVITCADQSAHTADFVLVTVPLGVLQGGGIEFIPQLPEWKSNQIHQHAVQSIVKVFATYDPTAAPFWPTNKLLTFISFNTPAGRWGSIMNLKLLTDNNVHKSTIVATVVGDEGRRLEWMDDAAVLLEFNEMIASTFSTTMQPVHFHVTKWGTNEFFKGAQSSWNSGFTSTGHDLAYSPHETVFFAGEHTSKTYSGTVTGAYLSGKAAAEKISDCAVNFQNGAKCDGTGDTIIKSVECQSSTFIRFTARGGHICDALPTIENILESEGDIIMQNSFFYHSRDPGVPYICVTDRKVSEQQYAPTKTFEAILVVATHLMPVRVRERMKRKVSAIELQTDMIITDIVASVDPVNVVLNISPGVTPPPVFCDDDLPAYGIALIAILCVITVFLAIILAYTCRYGSAIRREDSSPNNPDQP